MDQQTFTEYIRLIVNSWQDLYDSGKIKYQTIDMSSIWCGNILVI